MGRTLDLWSELHGGRVGKLEGLAVWLAGVQSAFPPRPLSTRVLLALAGDHGEVTGPPRAVLEVLEGGGISALAARANVSVRCLDLALSADVGPEPVRRHKVRHGSGRIAAEPATTPDEAERALRAGASIADAEIDSGADVLVLTELGEDAATSAAAVVAAVTGAEPVDVVGRTAGDAGWGRGVATVRDALRRSHASPLEPVRLLTELGGADLTAMSGALVAAAARRTPVVLDGLVPTAAALGAALLAPGAEAYWLAAHRSPDPAHTIALAHLRAEPLLDLGIAQGGGVGALLALPLLDAALALLPAP